MTQEVKSELTKIKSNPFKRAMQETPRYFKVVMRIGFAISGVSITLLGLPKDIQEQLPSFIINYSGYVFTASIVAVALSKTAIDEKKVIANIENKIKNK